MITHEVVPKYWDNNEIVASPIYGRVEGICIKSGERIYEWQPLIIIRKEQGSLEQILVGMSGLIDSLHVNIGDKVIPGEVLVSIKEDLFVTGSD
ncbi:hypothetical protein EV207_15021 [Scopulibacillus darangshiensis]|uniref:Biotin-dependent enzyme n=1 Tax=Scopulibacillus darangshiensis TaxID=442528 RepID=A0A4R2NHI0_9BACL|nr:hypothetical protein [Scopulibacillus darangshiensis]TCP20718.1 hypothetical protein EV207_15021 [Scopulibacillus darangshiensis]